MTVEIESFTAKLGEREYVIQTASFIKSKPWKQRLLNELQPIFDEVESVQGITFESPADLLKLSAILEKLFITSIVQVWDLLMDYSPVLAADCEYIEANATDKQILATFQGVVKLADPFGVVALMMRRFGLMLSGTL